MKMIEYFFKQFKALLLRGQNIMYYKYIQPSDRYIINIGTCALCGGVTRASGLQSRVTRAKWHHSWLFELTRRHS